MWDGPDGMRFDSVGDAMRSLVMQYDALPWDWLGWDGDGHGDDVMRCDVMPCQEVGLDGTRLDVGRDRVTMAMMQCYVMRFVAMPW